MATVTQGVSSAYHCIQTIKGRNDVRFFASELFGPNNAVVSELYDVYKESSVPGWDGGDAHPVDDSTLRIALDLVRSLPKSIPPPSLGANWYGDITFDWYCSKSRLMTVSVSSDGRLHFAALIGPNVRITGQAITGGIWPRSIIATIKEIYSL